MDEIVARAIAKWPNVPAVYGWLSLDRRGTWAIKGERIRNPLITEFIARNYAHDERGRWFFQNGPQRVFVRLAYTPLVYRTRLAGGLAFLSHAGQRAEQVRQAWLDDQGRLLIETELGIGVVHDQDLPEVLVHLAGPDGSPLADTAIEQLLDEAARATAHPSAHLDTASGPAPLSVIRAEAVPDRFRFDPDPRPAPGEPEC
jgi:hypothetical protein